MSADSFDSHTRRLVGLEWKETLPDRLLLNFAKLFYSRRVCLFAPRRNEKLAIRSFLSLVKLHHTILPFLGIEYFLPAMDWIGLGPHRPYHEHGNHVMPLHGIACDWIGWGWDRRHISFEKFHRCLRAYPSVGCICRIFFVRVKTS
jgi:hypothetical protein